jgi:hypothetical protein
MFDTRRGPATIGSYTDRFYNPARRRSALAFRCPIRYEMKTLAAAQVF